MADSSKICSRCKSNKSRSEFNHNKSNKDGLQYYCKDCQAKSCKEYFKKESAKEIKRKWDKENVVNNRLARKKYRAANMTKVLEQQKNWRINNPGKHKVISDKSYYKRSSKPAFKISARIRTGMWKSIRLLKDNRHWETLVDYTAKQLMNHLEKQFLSGMSWKNMGEWHIDHRIPISAFNFNSPTDIDFKRCWALSNLQPLWASDNERKNNKLTHPFQPALAMEI